ncbi:MAG: potassium transporter TrkG [bacterium]
MNLRFVGYLGALVIVAIGGGILVSGGVSAIYGDSDLAALLVSGGICLVVGFPLYVVTRSASRAYIGFREGFVAVVASWLVAGAFGALPYILAGTFSPIDALFESMSGFTTTGASVLTDFQQPHGIMFWRSLSHWYGGMGIVVLFIALLPAVGGGAIRLFAAEAPGPSPERLTPRLRDTAKHLWYIYVGLSAAEAIVLIALGIGPFYAVTHTFGTMATGGFSPLAGSIGEFGSWSVELVITVFMLLAGGNFALYFAFLSGRRRAILRDPEFRLYLSILVVSTILVATSLMIARSHFSVTHAFREAMFQVVSLQTTTGYVTADFDQWNSFAKTLLLMLMFVGGCAGSTAGGLKVARFLVLSKNASRVLSQSVRPRAVIPVKIGRRVVPDHVRAAVLGFFFLWITVFALGTLLLSTSNVSMVTSASAVAATLNNVGPGLELVGATLNYAPIAPFGKVVLMAMMLLGRLELLAVMLPFTRSFWSR